MHIKISLLIMFIVQATHVYGQPDKAISVLINEESYEQIPKLTKGFDADQILITGGVSEKGKKATFFYTDLDSVINNIVDFHYVDSSQPNPAFHQSNHNYFTREENPVFFLTKKIGNYEMVAIVYRTDREGNILDSLRLNIFRPDTSLKYQLRSRAIYKDGQGNYNLLYIKYESKRDHLESAMKFMKIDQDFNIISSSNPLDSFSVEGDHLPIQDIWFINSVLDTTDYSILVPISHRILNYHAVYHILKLDSNGNYLWAKEIKRHPYYLFVDLPNIVAYDNHYYVDMLHIENNWGTGDSLRYRLADHQLMLIKLSKDGKRVWENIYESNIHHMTWLQELAVDRKNSDILVLGQGGPPDRRLDDTLNNAGFEIYELRGYMPFIMRIDTNGVFKRLTYFYPIIPPENVNYYAEFFPHDFYVKSDGNILISGDIVGAYFQSPEEPSDIMVLQLNEYGCLDEKCTISDTFQAYTFTKLYHTINTLPTKNAHTFNFKIYPNPSRGHVKLELPDHISFDNKTVQVFDMNGRRVFSKRLRAYADSFDLDILNDGMYIIRVLSDDGQDQSSGIIYYSKQ